MKENGLLARSVFVTDEDGVLTHVQYVDEVSEEPDYDAALLAAGLKNNPKKEVSPLFYIVWIEFFLEADTVSKVRWPSAKFYGSHCSPDLETLLQNIPKTRQALRFHDFYE